MTRKTRVLRLRKLRRDREWSQDQLGARVGVDGVTICNYESGNRTPPLKRAKALAHVFGVSIEELFDEIEMPA